MLVLLKRQILRLRLRREFQWRVLNVFALDQVHLHLAAGTEQVAAVNITGKHTDAMTGQFVDRVPQFLHEVFTGHGLACKVGFQAHQDDLGMGMSKLRFLGAANRESCR